MSKLIIIIGTPGSGKTTYVQQNAPSEACYVGSDDIREQLLGSATDQSKNAAVFDVFNYRVRRHLEAGYEVWADATFSHAPARKEFVRVFSEIADHVEGVVMDTPLTRCIEFNSRRPAPVPIDVIIKMYNQLLTDPPSIYEGFSVLRRGSVDDV